jgi:hypothetical protein
LFTVTSSSEFHTFVKLPLVAQTADTLHASTLLAIEGPAARDQLPDLSITGRTGSFWRRFERDVTAARPTFMTHSATLRPVPKASAADRKSSISPWMNNPFWSGKPNEGLMLGRATNIALMFGLVGERPESLFATTEAIFG